MPSCFFFRPPDTETRSQSFHEATSKADRRRRRPMNYKRPTPPAEPTASRLRPGAVVWKVIDASAIVLDANRSEYLEFNATATLLLEQLDLGASDDDLVQRTCETFDIDHTAALADVKTFLDQCRRLGW